MEKLRTRLMLLLLAGQLATAPAALATAPPCQTISMLTAAPPRQTFQGFGWSLVRGGGSPFHGPLGNFSSAVREELLTLLCEELGTTVVRLWWTPKENVSSSVDGDAQFMDAYVNSGLVADLRKHGVQQLLLAPDRPCAPNALNSSEGGHSIALRAKQTAAFIAKLRAEDVVIDATGVANEPGCWAKWQNSSGATKFANWPKVLDQSGNLVAAVKLLSRTLSSEGVEPSSIKIIGPESASADSHGFAQVMACHADHECWSALDSIASHSYGMAANEQWANASLSLDKGYWVTESGAWGTESSPTLFPGNAGRWQGVALACRFLNDLNHGVDTWVWFIGAWIFDKQMLGGKSDCEQGCGDKCGQVTCGINRQEDMKLISTCSGAAHTPCYSSHDANGTAGAPQFYQLMPQYHYAKQLRKTFDIGCVMRSTSTNSSFLPGMTWSYGRKSSVNAAVGRNPDGSWGIAVANPTGIPTVDDLNGVPTQLFPNATTLHVELVLGDELILPDETLTFVPRRSTGTEAYNVEERPVVVEGGKVSITVQPNELLTLRSTVV
jgi:hypothetical protein